MSETTSVQGAAVSVTGATSTPSASATSSAAETITSGSASVAGAATVSSAVAGSTTVAATPKAVTATTSTPTHTASVAAAPSVAKGALVSSAASTPIVTTSTASTVSGAAAAATKLRVNQQHLSVVNELLGTYKTQMSAKINNAKTFRNAAQTFASVIVRVLNNPTQDAMMAMWNFFVAEKSGIMVESVALQGVEVLDMQTRMRVELTYTLFRQATNGIDVGDPTKVSQQILQTRLKCPQLIVFLQTQAKTVARATAAKASATAQAKKS